MATTNDYLIQLQNDKATLVDNLTTMGVTASDDETFTELVPKILDIESGSDVEITDASYLFYSGARISSLIELLGICKNATLCTSMFQNARTASIDLSNFNTSNVTDMSSMFQSCINLTSLDLSNFNTSNVTNMSSMFNSCVDLSTLNLSNFNTSNVTTMHSMFYNCQSLTEIDLSNFDTSSVVFFSYMFYNCLKLVSVKLNNSITSVTQSMNNMFQNCQMLSSIDLSNFDTSSVNALANMFYGCTNLTKIDISKFTSKELINNASMFYNCSKLATLIINNPSLFKMTSTNMLTGTPIASGNGYVYVPDDLVETYKSATNWSTYADQIKGMSELPTEEV